MAIARMKFELEPIQANRLFRHGKRYDQIQWDNFSKVVDNMQLKFEDWYVSPIISLLKDEKHGFAATSLTCTLIDSLSLYRYGQEESEPKLFKEFVRDHIPFFGDGSGGYKDLPTPIKYKNRSNIERLIRTYAELLYSCFRCGIVHGACVPLCGALEGDPNNRQVFRHENNRSEYRTGGAAPTYLLDPNLLFQEVKTYMSSYWPLVKTNSTLGANYKIKFHYDYGMSLGV